MFGYLLRNEPAEIYRLNLSGEGFEVKCSRTLLEDIFNNTRNEEMLTLLKGIDFREDGQDCRIASITLPYINFPNLSHKKADWEAMTYATRQLGTLLEQMNCRLEDCSRFSMSNQPQLIAFDCWCSEGAAPIAVGFSPLARKLLVRHWKEGGPLLNVQQKMTTCHERLSATRKRDAFRVIKDSKRPFPKLFGNATAGIRKEEGTPSFTVPGNCACLGANPDRFKLDGDIDSHNMDTPLQLLTMMTGVVSFWNDELVPRLSDD